MKEEILNYTFIDSYEYYDILDKANQYIHTEIAKSTKSRVVKQNSMKINDLICIIMYCDYHEISVYHLENYINLNCWSKQKQEMQNIVIGVKV